MVFQIVCEPADKILLPVFREGSIQEIFDAFSTRQLGKKLAQNSCGAGLRFRFGHRVPSSSHPKIVIIRNNINGSRIWASLAQPTKNAYFLPLLTLLLSWKHHIREDPKRLRTS